MSAAVHFQALQNFHSPETASHYVEGLYYTARPGNELLHRLIPGWLLDGKIKVVDGSQAQHIGALLGKVAGSGLVK